MTYLDLQRELHDQPFKPFRMQLVNSTTYGITEPSMVITGDSSAVVVTRVGDDRATGWGRTGGRCPSRTSSISRTSPQSRKRKRA
ncbi:MAG TPA: hypothetical protein VGR35_03915 [Tepidisphaeraceae bacterium]|nr:hypothetical protein [Tepidisphaeraceae bacterium]